MSYVALNSDPVHWNEDPFATAQSGDGATNAFISQWKTDNAGTSEDNQITLPLVSSGTYDFVASWGDGTQSVITAHDDAAVTHTYSAAGTYTVEITGIISGWQFNDGGDKEKILDVSQWGGLSFGVDRGHFVGCANLDVSATDAPDLTGVTQLRDTFRNSGIGEADLNAWDVSNVTNMREMLRGSSFNGDISAWDVSSVTNMIGMLQDTPFNGENYSRALIAWSRLPLQSNVTLDNTSAQYFSGAAAEARAKIANDFGWTISDDGEDTTSTSYAVVGQVLDGTTPLTDEPVVWTSEQNTTLDGGTTALHGEQAGRYALMTTDALAFPNQTDVNGAPVTVEETTFIYEPPQSLEGDWSHAEATTHNGLGVWAHTEATTNAELTYVTDIRVDGPGVSMAVFSDVQPGFQVTLSDGLQAGETYQWWIRLDGGEWEDQGSFTIESEGTTDEFDHVAFGPITDNATGEPIEGATVTITRTDNDQVLATAESTAAGYEAFFNL